MLSIRFVPKLSKRADIVDVPTKMLDKIFDFAYAYFAREKINSLERKNNKLMDQIQSADIYSIYPEHEVTDTIESLMNSKNNVFKLLFDGRMAESLSNQEHFENFRNSNLVFIRPDDNMFYGAIDLSLPIITEIWPNGEIGLDNSGFMISFMFNKTSKKLYIELPSIKWIKEQEEKIKTLLSTITKETFLQKSLKPILIGSPSLDRKVFKSLFTFVNGFTIYFQEYHKLIQLIYGFNEACDVFLNNNKIKQSLFSNIKTKNERLTSLQEPFAIDISDTIQAKKHSWLETGLKQLQETGKLVNVLVTAFDLGGTTSGKFLYDPETPEIILLFGAEDFNEFDLRTTIKHELTHLMQYIMGLVKTSIKDYKQLGLPGKYNPKTYQLYHEKEMGLSEEESLQEKEKRHALSDVEFFARLSSSIEHLKYVLKEKISQEDFNVLSSEDLHKLANLYNMKQPYNFSDLRAILSLKHLLDIGDKQIRDKIALYRLKQFLTYDSTLKQFRQYDVEKFNKYLKELYKQFYMITKASSLCISKRAKKDESDKHAREKSDPKWQELLIDKDGVKLTREEIRNYYFKNKDKILKEIKDKQVMLYIGTGKNQNILKRNHNEKSIIITNADSDKSGNPDNLIYWADRRLLSVHRVLGTKTKLGFVDLDIHNFSKPKTLGYAKKLSLILKKEFNVSPIIFESGGAGYHVEFELEKEIDIDFLRNKLKDLLDEFNKDFNGFTTGIVSGSGVRTDVSTLHEKGNLRVPYTIGETYGKEKKPISNNCEDTISKRAKDPLAKYKSKRKFDITTEPEGKISKRDGNSFVIHHHFAKHEHFDLRLERGGVLKSWAIPKHHMPKKNEKLLAMQVEDHPLEYAGFHGEIPSGEYGAGEVKIYDSGKYEEIEWTPKKIIFKLHGEKEKNTYVIVKTKENQWLLMQYNK